MLSEELSSLCVQLFNMIDRVMDEYPRTYFISANGGIDSLQNDLYQAIADENIDLIGSISTNLIMRINGKIPPVRSRDFYIQELDLLRFRINEVTKREDIKKG